jgi:hypothetical protein
VVSLIGIRIMVYWILHVVVGHIYQPMQEYFFCIERYLCQRNNSKNHRFWHIRLSNGFLFRMTCKRGLEG